jgi:acetylornithine/succinyldiaminopimelate/putrescine aminotransferase
MEKEIKMGNQLERYVQGLKSLGKAFWITFLLTASTGIASNYVKDSKAKEYLNTASGISCMVSGICMYKNRKKIGDCLNPYISNEELKNKYGLTGKNPLV